MTATSSNVPLFAVTTCDFGTLLVARHLETEAIASILIGDNRDLLVAALADYGDLRGAHETESDCLLNDALSVLSNAPASHAEVSRIPLALSGTDFQKRVWRSLRDIPVGDTCSYGTLAHSLGLAMGSRAVARACASNRHAIVVPCHRIIGAKGSLTGYRWGIERKRLLLEREQLLKEAARETTASRAA